jgi:uncharacterized protein with predicted RNA binding PUA domain
VSMSYLENSSLRRARTIAEYQFGKGTGAGLFPDECTFIFSRTGRIRQILLDKKRLATVRAEDGRLTLGIEGGLRLKKALPSQSYRVIIDPEVTEFIRQGKNAFARHVIAADPSIRADDEVLVVTGEDELLATGSAVLSGEEMLAFNYGVAVKVRQGSA